jgi:hypothetical protein
MDEGKRPGGLTALAVLNFVFSGWGFLSLLGFIALFALIGMVPTDNMEEAQRTQFEAFQDMGLPIFIFLFTLTLVSSVLQLLSGIGYIKQKKFLGRFLGNAYAVLAIASSVVSAVMFPSELGGGFSIPTIIGLIYPVLTLFLLNITFKEDFVN